MKIITPLLLLLNGFICCFAQNIPSNFAGTKTLYKPLQINYTPVPKGYEVAYINFAGRHGARHVTKDINRTFVVKALKKADSLGVLSPKGIVLKEKLTKFQKVEIKHLESISELGAAELKGIAVRMYKNEKELFVKSNKVLISTTAKGRTKQSAEAFLAGLEQQSAGFRKAAFFNYADDYNLRFFDFSPAYTYFEEHGSWIQELAQLEKLNRMEEVYAQFCGRIFKADFANKLTIAERSEICNDVFGFYTIMGALTPEIIAEGFTPEQLDLSSFFSVQEREKLAIVNSADDFLKKGPGMHSEGIQVKIAAPLLADFINSTDKFMKSQPYSADLRFAHAETIAPFAAIMGIKGASTAVNNVADAAKVWKSENVIPFSANIQWIFYKQKQTGDYLVKFLLNEKEVALNGFPVKASPYYHWTDVRRFYVKKLEALNFNLSGDPKAFLQNVK